MQFDQRRAANVANEGCDLSSISTTLNQIMTALQPMIKESNSRALATTASISNIPGLRFAPRLELLHGFSPLHESHHEGEIVRVPLPLSLPLSWPLKFSAPPPSLPFFCAAAVARSAPSLLCQRRRRRPICAVAPLSAPPPSSVLRRRLSAPPPPDVPVSLLPCLLAVALWCVCLGSCYGGRDCTKTDVALDASITPKSENLPFQVTPIRLTKDNYLSWSAALEIGITSRGRLPYITGDKPAPSKTDPQWANWALEDSQVKVWIISSVSADIQPLILRVPTSFEMWNVLAKMYGRKKRVLRTYQIKRSIYALKQSDLSVASYYGALKTKWEELDYHVKDNWDCGSDHARHWEREWMDRTFLFLGGLRDEFESIRSQILNCDEISGIEDVYARVESEEQRRQVMQIDPSRGSGPSAFVSRSSVPGQRLARRCTHCNKPGHSADFCWDLHPEKRLVHGRPPSSRRGPLVQESNQGGSPSSDKSRLSQDQIKELQAYIGRLSTTPEDSSTSDGAKLAQALVAKSDKGNPSLDNWIVDSGATHHMIGDSKMFQDYKLTSGQQRVSMADGSSISVAGKGSLSLLNKYCLHNALHVPNIPVNLLSVSSITKELNSNLIFSTDRCFLQNLGTGQKIGIGSAIDGLYRMSVQVASALISATSGKDSQMEGEPVEEQSRGHLFGQVYDRKKDVLDVVEATNPNLVSSPDDPSPMSDDLPIALRKGTSNTDDNDSRVAKDIIIYHRRNQQQDIVGETRTSEDSYMVSEPGSALSSGKCSSIQT
ncbi:hypothetical protein EJ110_NYTH32497 [Nymphaea thermarum]|nr:hypothetical protein EJ110_NYTH32497 [Nymphaea thermarum]